MRKKAIILVTVLAMITVIIFYEFVLFKTPTLQPKDYYTAYYNEYKKAPTTSYNYTFSPPVPMYQALLIALQSGGWNANSLKNMTVKVELDYCTFINSSEETGFDLLYPVTHSVMDWSPQQISNVTYRYVWTIIVEYSGPSFSIPPPGYYYVDAATAELVPTGILS